MSATWRSELRAVSAIAGPAAATQLGMMLMGAVDTMMLGRYSAAAMGAGALGHNLSTGVIVLAQGLLMAIDPLVAQPWGRRVLRRVRFHLQQGVMLALGLSLPIVLILQRVDPVLTFFSQQEELVGPTAGYVRTVTLGVPAFLLFVALRRGLQAMGIVRPALWVIVLSNLINVVANWALIFGHLGMPRLGVFGSALATSISRWSMVLLLVVLAWKHLSPLRLFRDWASPRVSEFALFFRIGLPISVHTGVEFWMIIGGRPDGRGSGDGGAGWAPGRADPGGALLHGLARDQRGGGGTGRAGGRARGHAGGSSGEPGVTRPLRGRHVDLGARLRPRAGDAEPYLHRRSGSDRGGGDPAADRGAVPDLRWAPGRATGALRGGADTRVPALIAVLGYWVFCLPVGYLLTHRLGLGATGAWWGLALGLGITAPLLLWRARRRLGHVVAPLETPSRP